MGKRIIIWSVLILSIGYGVRACYHYAICEYISVVHFANEKEQTIYIKDSTFLKVTCRLGEGSAFSNFEVVLKFQHKGGDLKIDTLKLSLIPIDGNEQIALNHIISYRDTIDPIDWNAARIRVKKFDLFQTSCKRISTHKDYNGYSFHFRTKEKLSDRFLLRIDGVINSDGKKLVISRKIKLDRTKEWVIVQMMT